MSSSGAEDLSVLAVGAADSTITVSGTQALRQVAANVGTVAGSVAAGDDARFGEVNGIPVTNAPSPGDVLQAETAADLRWKAGPLATIQPGTVTTLPAGSSATVTNSGTASAAVLNFGIPAGAAGSVTGVQGVAPDAGGNVDLTGVASVLSAAQTVSGVKTFTASPVVPTAPAGDATEKAASTAFVDAGFVPRGRQDIYLGDYVAGGGADETAGVKAAIAKAQATGRRLIGIPGVTVAVTAIIDLFSGCRIDGNGMTLDIRTDHSAAGVYMGGDSLTDVHIRDLTVTCTNATGRNQLYGIISFFGGSNITLDDVTILNSEGLLIYIGAGATTFAGATNVWINRPRLLGGWADGIHVTRGSSHVWINDAIANGTSDDAIAFVGIQTDDGTHFYGPITDVHVRNPSVLGFTASAAQPTGVKFNGVQGGSLDSGRIVNSPHYGIYVGYDVGGNGQASYPSSDVVISNTQVRAATNFGIAIQATNVTIVGGSSRSNGDSGLALISAVNSKIVGADLTNNTGFGVYETGSSGCHVMSCDLRGNTAGPSQLGDPATNSIDNSILT